MEQSIWELCVPLLTEKIKISESSTESWKLEPWRQLGSARKGVDTGEHKACAPVEGERKERSELSGREEAEQQHGRYGLGQSPEGERAVVITGDTRASREIGYIRPAVHWILWYRIWITLDFLQFGSLFPSRDIDNYKLTLDMVCSWVVKWNFLKHILKCHVIKIVFVWCLWKVFSVKTQLTDNDICRRAFDLSDP